MPNLAGPGQPEMGPDIKDAITVVFEKLDALPDSEFHATLAQYKGSESSQALHGQGPEPS